MTVRELTQQSPARHVVTVDFFLQMIAGGLLDEDDRVELLTGEMFQMTPIGRRHAAVVKRLLYFWTSQSLEDVLVSIQDPIRIDARSLPELDVALIRRRDDFYANAYPGPEDVWLLIEVADSSLTYDTERKLPLYASAAIPEVWIVNLIDNCIDRHLTPNAQGYRLRKRFLPGDKIAPARFPAATLDVREALSLPGKAA
ncbi:MAG: Uma2 family endonuclease [Caldilineaceae bacterium]|nr:Uma2 family endonuclease [Caldilineaceae bacterium]